MLQVSSSDQATRWFPLTFRQRLARWALPGDWFPTPFPRVRTKLCVVHKNRKWPRQHGKCRSAAVVVDCCSSPQDPNLLGIGGSRFARSWVATRVVATFFTTRVISATIAGLFTSVEVSVGGEVVRFAGH